ncbi:NAD(P)-dependent oxidoreductase [Parapedobacter tibetensis]|uniref:NAD(P)-dependent oxidoreductase n=1 Tax=Parapedobacter tibetensis TaxID=2972951 RepID=UPI00214D4445|nr:NAD(P)-binding domain-containing protein [Parapedobacter tibetensis]
MAEINKDVTVIGLGNMGEKLAHVLLENEYTVTVWNRDIAKTEALRKVGAVKAASPAAAISSSPITIMCVSDYEVSHRILNADGAFAALENRLIIELSTGTPQDARDGHELAKKAGAAYLDGAILATPPQMGRPDTPIFVSGERKAYETAEKVMKTLAGGLQYMGEPVGNASAWDLAFLSCLFGGLLGFYHGAVVLESEHIDVEAYGNMMAALAPITGEMIKYEGEIIAKSAFTQVQSSVKTSSVTFKLLLQHAEQAGINKDWPLFGMTLFKKAMDAGYGPEQVAALVKVIR